MKKEEPPKLPCGKLLSVAIQNAEDKARFNAILDAEHYLGARQPSGNTVYQVIKDEAGAWVAIALWCGACYRLDPRNTHIGWDMRKREEPPTARKALRGIGNLSGALVTGDAGNCSVATATEIFRLGGDYMLQVKGVTKEETFD